jgi:hypothetical protein
MLLTREYILGVMSPLLDEAGEIVNLAYGYQKKFHYVAVTPARAAIAKFSPGGTLDKVDLLAPEKLPGKVKWMKRWSGLAVKPLGYPHIDTVAELTQYIMFREEMLPHLETGEVLITFAMTRDKATSSGSNYYTVAFTDRRVMMFDLSSAEPRVSYARPLDEIAEFGLLYKEVLDPIATPLLAGLIGAVSITEASGAEQRLFLTNLFGQRQVDQPGGGGAGLGTLFKAAKAIKFMADQKKKALGPRTAAIGESVIALADRLEEAGSAGDPARNEHLAVSLEIAKAMPNLIEGLDASGNPTIAGPDECRKQARALMGL